MTKRPVTHSVEVSVPSLIPLEDLSEDESSTSTVDRYSQIDSYFGGTSSVAQVFSQPQLDAFIRKRKVSKKISRIIGGQINRKELITTRNQNHVLLQYREQKQN